MANRSPSAVFGDAPIEIVKTILDQAASDEKATAAKLMHVCRTTRQWAIPILYESVELKNNSSAIRFERTLEMEASSSPSSQQLASSVKHLHAKCMPNVDLLSERCRRVEAISLYNYDVPKLYRLVLPLLRHVTIAGSLRYSHFIAPGMMSALSTVTHLRFPNDIPRLSHDFIKAVPQLTHFSCCCCLTSSSNSRQSCEFGEELEHCLSVILEAPALQMALIFVHSSLQGSAADHPLDSLACALGRYAGDPRIVTASTVELRDATENLAPKYDRVWVLGSKKKTEQMRSVPRTWV